MKTIQINDRIHLNDLTRKAKQASKIITKLGNVRLEVTRRHDSDTALEPIARTFADLCGAQSMRPCGGTEGKGKIFLELR